MSRISNVIVKQREDFVKGLFRLEQDPPYSIHDANMRLALQPEFGMNKKMALKRIYELREEVRNEKADAGGTWVPLTPVVVSPIAPETVAAINNYMSDAVANSGPFTPVTIGEPVSTMNDNNSPIDLLAATA